MAKERDYVQEAKKLGAAFVSEERFYRDDESVSDHRQSYSKWRLISGAITATLMDLGGDNDEAYNVIFAASSRELSEELNKANPNYQTIEELIANELAKGEALFGRKFFTALRKRFRKMKSFNL